MFRLMADSVHSPLSNLHLLRLQRLTASRHDHHVWHSRQEVQVIVYAPFLKQKITLGKESDMRLQFYYFFNAAIAPIAWSYNSAQSTLKLLTTLP